MTFKPLDPRCREILRGGGDFLLHFFRGFGFILDKGRRHSLPPPREIVRLGFEDNPKKCPETANRKFAENHAEEKG